MSQDDVIRKGLTMCLDKLGVDGSAVIPAVVGMAFKAKEERVVIHDMNTASLSREAIRAYQIIEIGRHRFKLHANTSSSMCRGFNSDLCAKLITDTGLVNIIDSYSLGLPTGGSYASNERERKEKTIEVFEGFVEHLKELYA